MWTYKYLTICGTRLTGHGCQGCFSFQSCYKPLLDGVFVKFLDIFGLCIFCLRSEPYIVLSAQSLLILDQDCLINAILYIYIPYVACIPVCCFKPLRSPKRMYKSSFLVPN